MTIRPATPADLPAIAALHAANWRRDYGHLLPAAVLGSQVADRMARKWTPAALDKPALVLVAAGAAPEGFVAVLPDHPDGLFVDALHVDAAARGRGIGAGLVAAALRSCAPGRPVWLEVLEGNAPARAVYAAWGGVEGPVFADRVLGVDLPARRVTWPDGAALLARLDARVRAGRH